MHNIFIWLKVCVFLQMLVAVKKAVVGWHWWLWKEPVVMCGKWNVTKATLQQMFKVITFCTDTRIWIPVFFATDQLYRLPCSAEIQPIAQQDAAVPQVVRIANWYLIHVKKNEKMKNLLNFYKVVGRRFSGVVGNEVTVCFLLRTSIIWSMNE